MKVDKNVTQDKVHFIIPSDTHAPATHAQHVLLDLANWSFRMYGIMYNAWEGFCQPCEIMTDTMMPIDDNTV